MIKSPKDAARSTAMNAVEGFAKVMAFLAAFLLGPFVYNWSIGWVKLFVEHQYGYGFDGIVSFGWGCFCGVIVYYVCKASISVAIIMLGGWVIVRFL